MNRKKRIIAFIVCASMAMAFGGCGKDKASELDADLSTYPIKTEERLSYWAPLNSAITATVTGFAETELAKEMEKRTGVGIDWIHPILNNEQEQFNLLVASGDMPDIVHFNWFEFPGGPDKAIKDGVIIDLNEYMEYAPNLSSYLEERPDINRMVKSDAGKYYVFPALKEDPLLMVTAGPVVRKDLLDKYGIEVPTTYDDWYNMLKTFKDNGIKIPYTAPCENEWAIYQTFGTLGAPVQFYVEDETVKYGPLEQPFYDTLSMLAKWYKEGLIDANFSTSDSKIRESELLAGNIGLTYGSGGGGLGKWVGLLPEDSGIELASIPYPRREGSEGPQFVYAGTVFDSQGAAVTTSCAYPQLAAKFLDYFYGEEGHMLVNFGIEGVSYNMVDGKPTYTDLITNNPDGLDMSQAMSRYMLSYSPRAMIQDPGYITQYYKLDVQKDALANWSKDYSVTQKYAVPKILCTEEESREMAEIINNVQTYVNTMILKYITGVESLDKFDDFKAQLKKFNIDRAIEINQNAYERYESR